MDDAALFESLEEILRERMPLRAAEASVVLALASELFEARSSDELSPGWWSALRHTIGRSEQSSAADEPRCICGAPLVHGDAYSKPRYLHAYEFTANLDATVARNRRDAWKRFGLAWHGVLRAAHTAGPASIRLAAWDLIDRVDQGQRVLPALGAFYGVTQRALQLPDWTADIGGDGVGPSRSAVRRILAVASAMSSRHTDYLREDLHERAALVELLALAWKRGERGALVLLPPSEALQAAWEGWRDGPLRLRRSGLRRLLRQSRDTGLDVIALTRGDLRRLLPPRAAASSTQPIVIRGDDGWTAELLDPEAVLHEGLEMGHCVARYAGKVRRGTAQVLAMRKGTEHRATLVIQPGEARDEAMLTIAGPENDPFPLEALSLATRVLKELLPEARRVRWSE